jgi:hypothetical protein
VRYIDEKDLKPVAIKDWEEFYLPELGLRVRLPSSPRLNVAPSYTSYLVCPQNLPDASPVAQFRARFVPAKVSFDEAVKKLKQQLPRVEFKELKLGDRPGVVFASGTEKTYFTTFDGREAHFEANLLKVSAEEADAFFASVRLFKIEGKFVTDLVKADPKPTVARPKLPNGWQELGDRAKGISFYAPTGGDGFVLSGQQHYEFSVPRLSGTNFYAVVSVRHKDEESIEQHLAREPKTSTAKEETIRHRGVLQDQGGPNGTVEFTVYGKESKIRIRLNKRLYTADQIRFIFESIEFASNKK